MLNSDILRKVGYSVLCFVCLNIIQVLKICQILCKKVSKWTDDIKKDTRFCGIGTVNNQIHFANGSKTDRPTEDRSFCYELKDNEIFAYGWFIFLLLYFGIE